MACHSTLKLGNPDMDESLIPHAKWNKTVTKDKYFMIPLIMMYLVGSKFLET